jgi:uncharacterized protein (DUF488 family)
MAIRLVTVGHGTAEAPDFVELLHGTGIRRLIDVRTAPGSKRNPQFRRELMQEWLAEDEIEYRWEPGLGGFRKAGPGSPNTALRNPAFRGYADHMRTPAFRSALERVLAESAEVPTAVMCAESVWWRCHRRLLADAAALLGNAEVTHLGHDGRLSPHQPTEGVRRAGDLLIYDAGQDRLV